MDRDGFRNRMKQYKKAREENPGLKYWEWKAVPKYDEGTGSVEEMAVKRAFASKSPASNYSDAVDMKIWKIREWLTDKMLNISPKIPTGLSNCTLTASQWINPNVPIGRAATIVNNPENMGFTQIGEEHLIPGTMVIASKDPNQYVDGVNNIYHSMLLTGFADSDYDYSYGGKDYKIKKGEPLVTYSRGKNVKSDYRENIPLRVYNDLSDGKTYNRYYKPHDPNIKQVLLPEIIITPENLAEGGVIRIKEKNKGKFTESAKRAGMGVLEFARHVLANKDDYSNTQIKRANFARNASKWKHAEGTDYVQPDPLEVLERSRPKVAGIPINDRPLSGTDPIGEAMMWGLGGGAASAALRSLFPTYGATAGWLAFGDNGNENALVVKKPLRKGDPVVKPISTGNISEDTRDFYREYVIPLSDHLTEQEKLDFINNDMNFMYNVYPESRFDEGVLGFRNKYTGEIALNEKILDDPITFGRTMVHEGGHAFDLVKERPKWQTLRINRNSPRTKDQKKTKMGGNSEADATHEANKWDIVNNFELENGRKPTLAEFQLYTDVIPAKTLSSFRNRDSYGRMYEENEIKKLAQKHLTAYDYSKWLNTYKRNTLKYVPATIPFILTTNKEES